MANALDMSTVHYCLKPWVSGVTLEIWEPAAPTGSRQAPYYFLLSYALRSVSEAQQILDRYLMHNHGAVCLQAQRPPVEPTLGLACDPAEATVLLSEPD
jgi:hypothetical protein